MNKEQMEQILREFYEIEKLTNEFDDIDDECEHITECMEALTARIDALESELKGTIAVLCDAVFALQRKFSNTHAAISTQHRLVKDAVRAATPRMDYDPSWLSDQPKDYEK
jgi:hypothetical protein